MLFTANLSSKFGGQMLVQSSSFTDKRIYKNNCWDTWPVTTWWWRNNMDNGRFVEVEVSRTRNQIATMASYAWIFPNSALIFWPLTVNHTVYQITLHEPGRPDKRLAVHKLILCGGNGYSTFFSSLFITFIINIIYSYIEQKKKKTFQFQR